MTDEQTPDDLRTELRLALRTLALYERELRAWKQRAEYAEAEVDRLRNNIEWYKQEYLKERDE